MGLVIRALMVILVLIILVFNFFFLIGTSGTPERCRKDFVSMGYSSEQAVESCKNIQTSPKTRYLIMGISGVLIVICGIVFFVKRD